MGVVGYKLRRKRAITVSAVTPAKSQSSTKASYLVSPTAYSKAAALLNERGASPRARNTRHIVRESEASSSRTAMARSPAGGIAWSTASASRSQVACCVLLIVDPHWETFVSCESADSDRLAKVSSLALDIVQTVG